jgi:hypothetical protein
MFKRIILILVTLICLVSINIGCDIVSPEPSIEQIKSDLIGETITQGTLTWHFHALSEFQEVNIVDRIRQGNTVEYNVTLELEDLFSKNQYEAEVLLIYQRSGTSWQLFSILAMSLRETADSASI